MGTSAAMDSNLMAHVQSDLKEFLLDCKDFLVIIVQEYGTEGWVGRWSLGVGG